MRKSLFLSAALMAVLAVPAMAQRGDDRGGGDRGERGGGRPAAAAPAAPAAPAAAPAAPAAAPNSRADRAQQSIQRENAQQAQADAARAQRPTAGRNDNNRPDANRGNSFGRDDNNRGGNDNRGNSFGRNDNNRPGNNGARGNNRPNPGYAQYHRAYNASRQFHYRGGSYRRPTGWYARRWSYGDFLPSLFWSSNYWINDFNYYGLMSPPPGTVWVRDGDDALLIDRYSGEIIQVEYGIFY